MWVCLRGAWCRSDVHPSQSRQFRTHTQSAPGVCCYEVSAQIIIRTSSLLKFRRGVEPEVNSFSWNLSEKRRGAEVIIIIVRRRCCWALFLYTLWGEEEENECRRRFCWVVHAWGCVWKATPQRAIILSLWLSQMDEHALPCSLTRRSIIQMA